MKKTLLIAAAALAAGVISSQAQVYSQNIVGYVNVPITNGYTAFSVPLNASGNNQLTNVMPIIMTGALDGANFYVFNGTKFSTYSFDSNLGGIADAGDNYATNLPDLNPGTTILINNNTGVNVTNTFVGTVAISSGSTGTNSLPAGYSFVSSQLPVSGGVTTLLGLTNDVAGTFNGAQVLIPKVINGQVKGYSTYTMDNSFTTGWADAGDTYQTNEPTINVGSGFIFLNNAGAGTYQWIQSMP
jgi:hypothetical protein